MSRAATVVAVLVAICLGLPGSARATIVYERTAAGPTNQGTPHPGPIVSARNDGSRTRDIAQSGIDPTIAPNGRLVAYFAAEHGRYDLRVVGVHGGHSRLLVRGAGPRSAGAITWSRDSRRLVVAGIAPVLVNVATGRGHAFHIGDAGAADSSFSPDGTSIAFEAIYTRADAIILVRLANPLHQTQMSDFAGQPIWGRAGLAYSGPYGLELRATPAAHARVLVHARRLKPFPIAWAADGHSLLAAQPLQESVFPSQALFHALIISSRSGKVSRLSVTFREITGLSRDGKHILGVIGPNAVAVSRSGAVRVLAGQAADPTWDR